jgi:hypothetical protein
MPNNFLTILQKIQGNPFAILAELCLAGIWLYSYVRKSRFETFLKALEQIPKSERGEFCKKAHYNYNDLRDLPPRDRLRYLTHTQRVIAYLVTVLAIVALVVVAFASYRETQNDWKKKYNDLLAAR